MNDSDHSPTALALALLRTEGAGRVATNRLLERFGSHAALLGTPREQVLSRLPGIPRAEALVARLFEDSFQRDLEQAEREIAALASRQIEVVTTHHPFWPHSLRDLDRAHRPPVLYVFGELRVLGRPKVAFLARPPLGAPDFEEAQTAVRQVMQREIVPVTGLQHGFDTVVCKLAAGGAHPGIAVASCGLARVAPHMRPAAAALARAGGVLASSFPLEHGPFAHDDVERAHLMAALASAVVFVGAPDEAPERRAVRWALGRRPVFSTRSLEGAAPLSTAADLDRLCEAAAR